MTAAKRNRARTWNSAAAFSAGRGVRFGGGHELHGAGEGAEKREIGRGNGVEAAERDHEGPEAQTAASGVELTPHCAGADA